MPLTDFAQLIWPLLLIARHELVEQIFKYAFLAVWFINH